MNEIEKKMRERMWQVMGLIEVIGITWFVSTKADLRDPVIAGVSLASALLAVWLTRKWVFGMSTAQFESWCGKRSK